MRLKPSVAKSNVSGQYAPLALDFTVATSIS